MNGPKLTTSASLWYLAGSLVSGGLTVLIFRYFGWQRHIVFMLLAAAILLYLLKRAVEIRIRRVFLTASLLSVGLSATYVIGDNIQYPNLEFYPFGVRDIFWFLVLFVTFYLVTVGMYTVITKINLFQEEDPIVGKAAFRYWITAFLILVLCWMPAYLSFYPGTVTPDSVSSIEQGLGLIPLENTHPVLFTLMVGVFVRIGDALGNLSFGVALFSAFQMLLMAGILAYGLTWLRRKGLHGIAICFVGLYFIISQVFPIYAISMWKDVLFGATLLLLVIDLYDIWESKGEVLLHAKGMIKFVILILLTCFMRNNGIYVGIALLIVLVVYYRRFIKRLAPVFAAVMVGVLLIQGPLYSVLGIAKSPFQEAAGIPLQQVARTVAMGGQMTEEQREYLDRLLPIEEYGKSYTPYTSNNIKGHAQFDRAYFNETKGEFIKIWAQMLFPNLKHYVKAYLMETSGYWHVSVKDWIVAIGTKEMDIGLTEIDVIQSVTGISMKGFLLDLADFISVGGLVWIVVFIWAAGILLRRKGAWLYILPLALLWGTNMIAAPTYVEFRYLFSFALAIPFLIAMLFVQKKDGEGQPADDEVKG